MNFVQLHLHYLCHSCRMSGDDPCRPLNYCSLALSNDGFVLDYYGELHIWNSSVSAPVLPTLYHLKNELSPNKLQRRLACQISDHDVTFPHVLWNCQIFVKSLMINVNWSQTKSIFSFHDQTRVSNKDNKSYSNVASERWYQNHDKNQIEQQHQNHIKFKSVSPRPTNLLPY